MINLSALAQALGTLDDALAALARDPENGFIRDACIQRFEYCYELAHKSLRRYLATTEADATQVQQMSFADLIRRGWERGLVTDEWALWRGYREARNATSHAYDGRKAAEVLDVVPRFLASAVALLDAIRARGSV